jgi:hypothetical protein
MKHELIMENWRRFKILNEDGAIGGPILESLTSKHKAALGRGIKKYPKFKHFISKAKMDPKYGSLPNDWGAHATAAGGHLGRVTRDYQSARDEIWFQGRVDKDPDQDMLVQILGHYVKKIEKERRGSVEDTLKELPGPISPEDRRRASI